MLSLVLALSLSVPSPQVKVEEPTAAFTRQDPAIQAELAKIDHTNHWLMLGAGTAFVVAGSCIAAFDRNSKAGGTVVIGLGVLPALWGSLGLANLME